MASSMTGKTLNKIKVLWKMAIVILLLAFSAYPINAQDTAQLSTEPITVDNADEVRLLDTLAFSNVHSGGGLIFGLAWSPDGGMLAASSGSVIYLWNITDSENHTELDGDIGFVNSVAFSPDGRIVAAAGGRYNPEERGVQLWEVATGEPLLRLENFDETVFSVSFSPDGTMLAVGVGNWWGVGPGSAQIWDIMTGELLVEFGVPNEYVPSIMQTVYGLTFSPDGTLLAAVNGTGRVQLWDVANEQERTILSGVAGYGYCVAFSPDGTILAVGGSSNYSDSGGDLRLWDVATGEQILGLDGHRGAVKGVSFNVDGQVLASASQDGTVRLWDVASGSTLAVRDAPNSWAVAFSPDGTLLATSSFIDGVRLWGVQR